MTVKSNDYICGNCKYWDCDEDYCQATGEHERYEQDTCDGWTEDDFRELTDDEKRKIKGDMEAHRRMVEGEKIE